MVNKEQRASAPVEEIKTKSNIKNVQFIFMPTHPANHLASSIHIHIYCRQEEKSKLPSEKCQWELFLPPKHFSIVGLSLILFKHIPSGIQPQTVSWRSHNAWIPGRLQPLMSQQWRWYRLKVSPGCVFSIPGKDRSLLNKSLSQSTYQWRWRLSCICTDLSTSAQRRLPKTQPWGIPYDPVACIQFTPLWGIPKWGHKRLRHIWNVKGKRVDDDMLITSHHVSRRLICDVWT